MKNKRFTAKILIDIGMTICLLLLMPYSLLSETVHEWIGMAMLVLFISHHILNHKWVTSVRKGKYNAFRVIQTVLVIIMLILIMGSMISGILLSNHIFKWIKISGTYMTARQIHMFCAYWGLVVMSLHLGFHYHALEDLYDEGEIRAIGISNFYVDRMVDFASFNRIKPMVNQVETHIFNQQKEMKEWADKYDIRLEAWAPFGEGRGGTFENPVIAEIAEKYQKTPAQVMLRWHIQRGVAVIPKSTHIERMEENFNVFDFTLSDEDMKTIAELDKKTSSFFSHQDPNMVE